MRSAWSRTAQFLSAWPLNVPYQALPNLTAWSVKYRRLGCGDASCKCLHRWSALQTKGVILRICCGGTRQKMLLSWSLALLTNSSFHAMLHKTLSESSGSVLSPCATVAASCRVGMWELLNRNLWFQYQHLLRNVALICAALLCNYELSSLIKSKKQFCYSQKCLIEPWTVVYFDKQNLDSVWSSFHFCF